MRIQGILTWLICSALLIGWGAGSVRAEPAMEYVAGQVLVKLASTQQLGAVAAAYNLDPTPLDQFGQRAIYLLRILDTATPLDKAAAMLNDSRVIYAEPNYLAQAPEARARSSWLIGGSVEDYAAQWAPNAIRLAEAHSRSKGNGVTVAVLDSGVDIDHPALLGRLRSGFDFVDFDADPREEGAAQSDPGYGHGTHVAGLIALAAPEAQILPIRVLDTDGAGNIWVLAEALVYAVDPDGDPNTNDGARVINLSLGTLRPTDLLDEIVAEVTCVSDNDDDDDDDDDDDHRDDDDDDDDRGDDDDDNEGCTYPGNAVVISAAGNSGDETPYYPAAEQATGALAVGASNEMRKLALFSTRGPWVGIAAPGEQIISTVPGGAYATWSGTSMAAPLTAGTAALLRSAEPGLSPAQVVARLQTTAAALCSGNLRQLDAAAVLGIPQSNPPRCQVAFLPLVQQS
jgi:thermitase